jgi:hypothetical protein
MRLLAAQAGDDHFVIRPGRASLFRKLMLQLFHLVTTTTGTIVVVNTTRQSLCGGPERLDQTDERPRVARVQLQILSKDHNSFIDLVLLQQQSTECVADGLHLPPSCTCVLKCMNK